MPPRKRQKVSETVDGEAEQRSEMDKGKQNASSVDKKGWPAEFHKVCESSFKFQAWVP
jgi:hypothetical protein